MAGVLAQLAEQDEKVYVGPPWIIDGHDALLNHLFLVVYPKGTRASQ